MRAWVAGSQHICRKSSLASAQSKRAVRSSPSFLYDPRTTFSFGRRGLFAETPSRASLGRGASAYLQEELRSLCPEQEGRQEFPWLFVRPSRNLFVRKEGFVCRNPLEGEPRLLGLGKVCRESPRASARSERAVRSSPGFLCDPRASFSLGRRGGICQATLGGRER